MAGAPGLRQLYTSLDEGDLEELRRCCSSACRLSVPHLGIEIVGLEAIAAWVREQRFLGGVTIRELLQGDSVAVASVEQAGTAAWHLFMQSAGLLTSWLVVRDRPVTLGCLPSAI
jgi:hypothetical protein